MATRGTKNQERVDEYLFRKHQEGVQYRSEKFIPTADDWFPCFFIDANGKELKSWENENWESGAPMVQATVMMNEPIGLRRSAKRYSLQDQWFVRICIWGNDDTGIEKDFYFKTREEAFEQYHRLVSFMNNLVIAQRNELLKLGFVNA